MRIRKPLTGPREIPKTREELRGAIAEDQTPYREIELMSCPLRLISYDHWRDDGTCLCSEPPSGTT
jgi:hypothetical protein